MTEAAERVQHRVQNLHNRKYDLLLYAACAMQIDARASHTKQNLNAVLRILFSSGGA